MKTAKIIAEPHNLEVHPLDGLREINHGHWEEKTRAEVEKEYGDEYSYWENDPFSFAPTGGESGMQVLTRALPNLRTIVASHPGQTVLVVSHKATIRLLIGSFLGFDLRKYRDNLDQHPCCLNILDFADAKTFHARLILFNDISHYISHSEKLPCQPQLSNIWNFHEEEDHQQQK